MSEFNPDFLLWNQEVIPCREGDGYVSATAMCRAGKKRWAEFHRLDSTTRVLDRLSAVYGIPKTGEGGLIQARVGGAGHFTWIHQDVAVELATWISSDFGIQIELWLRERNRLQNQEAQPEEPAQEATPALQLELPEVEGLEVEVLEPVAQEPVAADEAEEDAIDWSSFNYDPAEVEVLFFNGIPIRRRRSDGYLDATAMCQANGKKWNDFYRLDGTQQFLRSFESEAGIPASGPAGVVQSLRGGASSRQGTWIHRILGLKLAAWLSSEFELKVYQWYDATAGQHPLYEQPPQPQLQPSQAELNLARLKTAEFGFSFLERIGGVTDRVRIQFTDMVMNILNVNNPSSVLQPQEDPFLCLSVAWRDVTGKEIAKGVDSAVGRKLAALYRQEFNEEPPKHMADVSGHAVPVNAYRQSWLIPMVRKVAISMNYDVLPGDDDRPVLRVVN